MLAKNLNLSIVLYHKSRSDATLASLRDFAYVICVSIICFGQIHFSRLRKMRASVFYIYSYFLKIIMLEAGLDLGTSARHTFVVGDSGEVGSDSRNQGLIGL